jgi:hypothetical protein
MQTVPQTGASATLNEQPFFMKPPHDLRRKAGGKPLAVLFESRHCAPCDELHKEGFKREATRKAMARFDIARFSIAGRDPLTTPQGKATTAEAWARELKIAYTPSVVFFDDTGKGSVPPRSLSAALPLRLVLRVRRQRGLAQGA